MPGRCPASAGPCRRSAPPPRSGTAGTIAFTALAHRLATASGSPTGPAGLPDMVLGSDPHIASLEIAASILAIPGGCLAVSLATGRTRALVGFARWVETPGNGMRYVAIMAPLVFGPSTLAIAMVMSGS